MWILVVIFLLIFISYLLKTKNIIITFRLTIEKIVISAVLLVILNIIINNFGLQVAVNEYTVSLVSLLEFPGLVVVLLLQNVIFM